ncbi:DUF6064 family protein [Marinobacteraceae bacterium S3BR75-40.1]
MGTWATYDIDQLLLFSPQVYWRLLQLHNQNIWPWQIVTLALGLLMIAALLRPRVNSSRAVMALLVVSWLLVAWDFLATRYATINWAVEYVVPFFLLQAVLLTIHGAIRNQLRIRPGRNIPYLLGLGLTIYAVTVHPWVAVLGGHPLAAAEVFGIFPDPTAIATLGVLTTMRRNAWVLLLLTIPILWCLISGLTLYAMEAWSAWITLAAATLALVAHFWPRGG